MHSKTGSATFRLLAFNDGILEWEFRAPADGSQTTTRQRHRMTFAAIAALNPPPETIDDAPQRLGWRKQRAANALRAWREL